MLDNLSAIAGIVGVLSTVALYALAEWLRRKFATREDLDGYGSRVNALESVAVMAKDTADSNTDRIIRLEEAASNERGILTAALVRIDKTLTDIDERHRQQQNEITRTVTLLGEIEKRLDRRAPMGER